MQNKSNLKYYSLDFSLCTTLGEVYAVIQRSLKLPEWFGANLDALWDALIGIMHTPAQIAVNKAVKNADLSEDVEEIVSVIHEAEERYHDIIVVVK